MESYSFWSDVLERVWRNVLQTLAPIVAVVASSGRPFDPAQVAISCAAVAVYTVLKALAGVTAGVSAPLWVQLVDRAGSAVAATLLAFVPESAMHGLADWMAVDWASVGWAALGSAALALVTYWVQPPLFAKADWEG